MLSEPSIKTLLLRSRFNDTVLSSASGFLVKKGQNVFLITNRHVFTGRNQTDDKLLCTMGGVPNCIEITHNVFAPRNALAWQARVEPLLNDDEHPLWFEHPTLGAKADVVALKLTNLDNVVVRPYNLDDQGDEDFRPVYNVTERVSVVGFPFGVQSAGSFAIWATGFIASEPDTDYQGLPVFLIDCRTREGQSGSPVIFHNSTIPTRGAPLILDGEIVYTELLGIYSGRINEKSDLGMVWKIALIKELIESIP